MLYFDQVDNKRFGTKRQQFWALAHFPFHISLVLLMEGTARFITWRNAIEVADRIIWRFDEIDISSNDTTVLATKFTKFSKDLLKSVEADDAGKFNVTQYIHDLKAESEWDSEAALAALDNLFGTLLNATFKFFKIQASKKDLSKTPKDPTVNGNQYLDLFKAFKVYDLVFVYFFVAAGLTLVMMAILIALAKKGKCAGDYAAILLRLVVGCGLAMISIVKVNTAAQQNFLYSAYMLPSVLLGLFIVVVSDGIFGWVLPAPRPLVSSSNSH
ncbi:hypothetical protein MMC31_005147 [Peltigera leucophlebia]|nr:hypothetical protein [Peltigera leucophlebia]